LLHKNFFSAEQVVSIVNDFRQAGLTAEEVALMSFAQKVVLHANKISEADITTLRDLGLTDEEILDVVLTCTARSFFSKTLDTLNARPDDAYLELEPELLKALVRGRPFP
jgi:alkylhydroperoxidase family enzyme